MLSRSSRIYLYFFICFFCLIGIFIGFLIFTFVKKSNYENTQKSSVRVDYSFDGESVGTCLKKELCPGFELKNMNEKDLTNNAVCEKIGAIYCLHSKITSNVTKTATVLNRKYCGTRYHDRILGEEKAVVGEFTFYSVIKYMKDSKKEFACGGSLISGESKNL